MAEPKTVDSIMAKMGDDYLAATATANFFAAILMGGPPEGMSQAQVRALAEHYLFGRGQLYGYRNGQKFADPQQQMLEVAQ